MKTTSAQSREDFLKRVERSAATVGEETFSKPPGFLADNAVFLYLFSREAKSTGRPPLRRDAFFAELVALTPLTSREIAEGLTAYFLWRRWSSRLIQEIVWLSCALTLLYIATGWAWAWPVVWLRGSSAADRMADAPNFWLSLIALTAWSLLAASAICWWAAKGGESSFWRLWTANRILDELCPMGSSFSDASGVIGRGFVAAGAGWAMLMAVIFVDALLFYLTPLPQSVLWFYPPGLTLFADIWAVAAPAALGTQAIWLFCRAIALEGDRQDPIAWLTERVEEWRGQKSLDLAAAPTSPSADSGAPA
jgi:hypothetical protein